MDVEAIISSPMSLDLMRCYSLLYLNGSQCRGCASSQRGYYRQLMHNGITKAMDYEKIKTRTCKPAWKGLMFIHKEGRHFNDEFITDEQAIALLNRGHLTEKDFTKLPDGYSTLEVESPKPTEPKKEIKKQVRKHK